MQKKNKRNSKKKKIIRAYTDSQRVIGPNRQSVSENQIRKGIARQDAAWAVSKFNPANGYRPGMYETNPRFINPRGRRSRK